MGKKFNYEIKRDYKYVDKDFQSMPEDERDAAIVRTGKIDAAAVFQNVMKRNPSEREIEITEKALIVAKERSRCHRDLMALEFGEKESTFADVSVTTDILSYPVDARIGKLNEALSTVRKVLRKNGVN